MKLLNKVIQPYSKPSGRGTFYSFDFQLRGIRVRRRSFATYDEAYAMLVRIRMDIFAGQYCPSDYFSQLEADVTAQTFWETYHLPYMRQRVKESTLYVREKALNKHFFSVMGRIKLRSLTTTRMNRFFTSLTNNGLNSSYQQTIWIGIKAMFKHAEELGYIDSQPKNTKPKRSYVVKRVLGLDEINRLFQSMIELEHELEVVNIVKFMFFSGCRLGEAIAIRHDDWDMAA